MITLADHFANPSRLLGIAAKGKENGKGDLILGFMTVDYDKDVEVLYALHPDGVVYRTHELNRPNNDFNRKGRKWFQTLEAPESAEFIGHYPPHI